MSRPVKPRIISFMPQNKYFIPACKLKCGQEVVILKLEELEAIRLKDIEKLTQEECALQMKVSRQTFQLIIDNARKKIAYALVQGKAISIEGGNYTFNVCKYKCKKCEYIFDKPYEKEIKKCPQCSSSELICIDINNFCKKRCRKNKNCNFN